MAYGVGDTSGQTPTTYPSGTAVDFGKAFDTSAPMLSTWPGNIGTPYASVQPVSEMTLTCSCRAELKLTNYVIPDALNYAKEWWKAHKGCGE